MSILHEMTMSRLNRPRPGQVEVHGDQVRAPLLFDGGSVLWMEDRNELIALISSARDLLRDVDETLWQLRNAPPGQDGHSGPMHRPYADNATQPYVPPMTVPAAAANATAHSDVLTLDAAVRRPQGAHAAPTGQAAQGEQEGQVMPDPPHAAAGP